MARIVVCDISGVVTETSLIVCDSVALTSSVVVDDAVSGRLQVKFIDESVE